MKIRGRFQIHLSTAIIMMFVAGLFLLINFRPYRMDLGFSVRGQPAETYVVGWPIFYTEIFPHEFATGNGLSDAITAWRRTRGKVAALEINIATAVVLIGLIAATLEYRIRRRESRNHE